MKQEDDDLEKIEKMLSECYLEPEQSEFLVTEYFDQTRKIHRYLINEEIGLPVEFIDDLSIWWAADVLRHTEIYRYYVNQVLIKETFIDVMRDYTIRSHRNEKEIHD